MANFTGHILITENWNVEKVGSSSVRLETIQKKPGCVHANFLGVLFTGHSRQCL